jgi:hypothetical protein
LFLQSYDRFNVCLTTNVGFTGGRVIVSLIIFGAPALICTGFGVGMFLIVSCGWNGAAGMIAGPCALNLVAPISNANSKYFISVTII